METENVATYEVAYKGNIIVVDQYIYYCEDGKILLVQEDEEGNGVVGEYRFRMEAVLAAKKLRDEAGRRNIEYDLIRQRLEKIDAKVAFLERRRQQKLVIKKKVRW